MANLSIKKGDEEVFHYETKHRNKRNYNKMYRKNNNHKINRGFSRSEYIILWTLLWLTFTGFLCLWFYSLEPLWLLVIWFFGIL